MFLPKELPLTFLVADGCWQWFLLSFFGEERGRQEKLSAFIFGDTFTPYMSGLTFFFFFDALKVSDLLIFLVPVYLVFLVYKVVFSGCLQNFLFGFQQFDMFRNYSA